MKKSISLISSIIIMIAITGCSSKQKSGDQQTALRESSRTWLGKGILSQTFPASITTGLTKHLQ